MLQNRPRAVFQQNKNAANIQLASKNVPIDQLIDLSEDSANIKPQPQQQPYQQQFPRRPSPKKQLLSLPTDENKPQQEAQPAASAVSKIPTLSFRLSNVPILNKNNSTANTNNSLKSHNLNNINSNCNDENKVPIARRNPFAAVKSLATLLEVKPQKCESPDEDKSDEIEDIDKSTSRDAVFLVCDVAKDIYDYMYNLEKIQFVSENYLKDQVILTPKVRQRLVNWCISINTHLKLLPETLYITISIIDRFFQKFVVEKQHQVQLFASAATLIASKYEEIYPPNLEDIIYLTQNNYSKREILRAEIYILKLLEFELGKPIPLAFLRRFSKAANCTLKMHSIAKYLMELSLPEYECAHWPPSMLAASALFSSLFLIAANSKEAALTKNNSGLNGTRAIAFPTRSASRLARPALSQNSSSIISDRIWTKQMVHYTRYTKEQVLGPASTLCKILKRSQKSPSSYESVKKNLQELAKWPELKTSKVDDLIKLGEQCS